MVIPYLLICILVCLRQLRESNKNHEQLQSPVHYCLHKKSTWQNIHLKYTSYELHPMNEYSLEEMQILALILILVAKY